MLHARWLLMVACGVVACVGDNPVGPQDSGTDTGAEAGGGDGAADADAGPAFTPASFGGRLVLWLDANEASTVVKSGNDVTNWTDRSGKSNNAVAGAKLSTGSLTLSSSSGIGGKSAVGFNLASMTIPDSLSLQFATAEFLIEVVASVTNQGDFDRYIVAKYDDTGSGFGMLGPDATLATAPATKVGGFLEYNDQPHATVTGATADGAFRVYGMHRLSGTSLEFRSNGASSGPLTVTSRDVSKAGKPLTLGASNATTPNNPLASGQLAEVVIVSGAASASEVADLESYFKTKYGLSF